jgi:hypothetical protein
MGDAAHVSSECSPVPEEGEKHKLCVMVVKGTVRSMIR